MLFKAPPPPRPFSNTASGNADTHTHHNRNNTLCQTLTCTDRTALFTMVSCDRQLIKLRSSPPLSPFFLGTSTTHKTSICSNNSKTTMFVPVHALRKKCTIHPYPRLSFWRDGSSKKKCRTHTPLTLKTRFRKLCLPSDQQAENSIEKRQAPRGRGWRLHLVYVARATSKVRRMILRTSFCASSTFSI